MIYNYDMEKMCLPEEITTCIKLLNQNHYECFVVGGAVRDALLHRNIHDYDLSTNATPDEVHQVFHDYPVFDTGIQHGTVTVVINHIHIEITTYRKESNYSDHRHPDKITFTKSIQDDCARRDLTINAFAYHPDFGVQDFFHGLEDLHNKEINCVGNPDERFNEDALRILRALRFATELNFNISSSTARAIHQHKDDLKYIAIERITEEFNKILVSYNPGNTLYAFRDVLEVFIKDINILTKEDFLLLDTARNDLTLRYAVLFLKLNTNTLATLKLPNHTISDIKLLINHASLASNSIFDVRYLLYQLKDKYPIYLSFRKTVDSSFNLTNVQEMIKQIQLNHDCISLKQLAITGLDLQQIGLTGLKIKQALETCLLKVMKDELHNEKEELLSFCKSIN